jgi:hypothetical protein
MCAVVRERREKEEKTLSREIKAAQDVHVES